MVKQLQVAISRQQAEAVLTEFLAGKVAYPKDCALCWLEDILKHHLINWGQVVGWNFNTNRFRKITRQKAY
jgi:hypothetical protein